MNLNSTQLSEAFGNQEARERAKRNTGQAKIGLGMAGTACLIALVISNPESLAMGPNPNEISLEMANIAALRAESDCGIKMNTPPHMFDEIDELRGQSNFATAPLADGQEGCLVGVLDTLASEVDGCEVRYVRSGWKGADEESLRYAVKTDCLSNYLPRE